MVRYMNKFFLCLLLLIPQYLCGQTYYYKLTKKIVDGVTYTNTAGGQFITFSNNFCFESDNKGNTVGNGLMAYVETVNGSLIYNGSCYFGSNSKFKFNNDKSVLNIVPSNGVIYIYRRVPAPNNQYTCTLIKKVEKTNSSGDSNYSVNNNYPVFDNSLTNDYGNSTISSQQTSVERSPSKQWKTITREVDCRHCSHSGKCKSCNGKGYFYNSFDISKIVDCPNCYHKTGLCSFCQGKGTVTKIERIYE